MKANFDPQTLPRRKLRKKLTRVSSKMPRKASTRRVANLLRLDSAQEKCTERVRSGFTWSVFAWSVARPPFHLSVRGAGEVPLKCEERGGRQGKQDGGCHIK